MVTSLKTLVQIFSTILEMPVYYIFNQFVQYKFQFKVKKSFHSIYDFIRCTHLIVYWIVLWILCVIIYFRVTDRRDFKLRLCIFSFKLILKKNMFKWTMTGDFIKRRWMSGEGIANLNAHNVYGNPMSIYLSTQTLWPFYCTFRSPFFFSPIEK